MTTPQSKRAAPGTSQGSSKKQTPQSSAGETYRDPAAAASSPGADALHLAQANVAFGRTMLDAIELLREAHPDNESLGAALALMEPIETRLIYAAEAAERALPVERPLGYDPSRARLIQSNGDRRSASFEKPGGVARLQVAHGRLSNGREGITLRLLGSDEPSSPIHIRDHNLKLIANVLIQADEPYAGELREMIAFLHHVLNEGGEL